MRRKIIIGIAPVALVVLELLLAAAAAQFTSQAVQVTLVVNLVVGVLLWFIYTKFLKHSETQPDFDNKQMFRLILLQVPIWLCCQITATFIINTFPSWYPAADSATDSPDALAYVFLCMVLAPVTEELLFRGVWYKCYEQLFGFVPAVILSSVMFGLMHGNIPQGYVAMTLGLFYVCAVRRTGRLRTSIILHAVANLTDSLAPVLRVPTVCLEPYVWGPVNVLIFICLILWMRDLNSMEPVRIKRSGNHAVPAGEDGYMDESKTVGS